MIDVQNNITNSEITSLIFNTCKANKVPELAHKISFRFRNNMTRCFGQAWVDRKLIEFSVPLWERATPEEREQVVIHETCHIIAGYKHKYEIKPHGLEWRSCMIDAGAEPDRCHRIDRKGLKRQYVKYGVKCSCTSVWVSHVKAAQIRKRSHSCMKCKSPVSFTGDTYREKEGKILYARM